MRAARHSTAGKLTYDAGPGSDGRGACGIPGASFVTEPMTEDVEITGHTNLVMWVSSETEDMDVFAFLKKINPDGSVVPIEVEIWATSMVFQKGSRIRVDVLPSDGGHNFSSYHLKNNSVYTGGDRASYVQLPIVPAKPGTQLTKLGGIKNRGWRRRIAASRREAGISLAE